MQDLEVIVDFNGIVLFDPTVLSAYDPRIRTGDNLYRRFTRTDDGDAVVEQGIVVPILGINDSMYRIVVRDEHEASPLDPATIIVTNGVFPLTVSERLAIADMACLLEWDAAGPWQWLDVRPGCYAVTIRGFRRIEHREVTEFGYEIVIAQRDRLPAFTGSLLRNMQVLELPGDLEA